MQREELRLLQEERDAQMQVCIQSSLAKQTPSKNALLHVDKHCLF